ncbi:MAG TPA: DoxX family protein [Chitinophagaceae bacterium]|jgi:uncharacterized membrane protein YphA (DoxX/SURF4 family)|nr:DoxX family protein [Chitinophagaceae bacterium]
MKKINIIYWISTGLFAFFMLGSAIPDIFSIPMAVEGFRQMGMPAYLLPFLGTAKLLGVIALFIPGFPRVREWAYAGLIFDLIGATYSVKSSGMPVSAWSPMLIIIALGFCSYVFYHKKRKAKARSSKNQVINHVNPYTNAQTEIANAGIA